MYKKTFFALFFLFILTSCAHSDTHSGHQTALPELKGAEELANIYGISIVSLRPTAAGQLLDLRYKVTNPDLAKSLFKTSANVEFRLTKPKEMHDLQVPETDLGKLKNKTLKPKLNQIFYVLFENPGAKLKKGDHVSLFVGKVQLDNINVE